MPRLFDALDAVADRPPPPDYYGTAGSNHATRCVNCGATGLPSMGWHLDPDTGEYECGLT